MCCGGKICMLCTCLILVVIVIGMLFGFGVFKNGFHKLKDTLHEDCHNLFNATSAALCSSSKRPFLGVPAAAPPVY
nr:uncharacterized protein LOC104877630 [Ipomoea trifida]GMC47364.1 Estrogen receptor beta like [Ipomoea batatas]GMC51677.1 Estrogen receptor beta like [Ipomoea batatas]GMC53381.1 Estrogen receptor beta like [Ipomoea batatas]